MGKQLAIVIALGLVLLCSPSSLGFADLTWVELPSELDVEQALECRDRTFDIEGGSVTLEDGVVFPVRSGSGRSAELLFVGTARVEMTPPDALEARQLLRLTGHDVLDAALDFLVIAPGDQELIESLLEGPPADPSRAVRTRAKEVFTRWHDDGGRERLAAGIGTAKGALGDGAYGRFLALWGHSEETGWLYYVDDPGDREPVRVGALEYDAEKEGWREKTWVSAVPWNPTTTDRDGGAAVAPVHYELEVRVEMEDAAEGPGLDVKAKIRFEVLRTGRRFARLELQRDLKVSRVTTSHETGGTIDLPHLRAGRFLHVQLPAVSSEGAEVEIAFEYGGEAFHVVEPGAYALKSTTAWYPRTGAQDRATYEVDFRWPAGFELMSSGRPVHTESGDDYHREKRVLNLPALGFSFEFGKFLVETLQVGHVELVLGFGHGGWDVAAGIREEIRGALRGALQFYETVYGPYPLDRLTVATIPGRNFGQGHLGFVTLPHGLLNNQGIFGVLLRTLDRDRLSPGEVRVEFVAHELAHQWWGNMVGWSSYRDQWLSEALAEYSAVKFVSLVYRERASYLNRRAVQWREKLLDRDRSGRTYESAGPVVLGTRLIDAGGRAAYSAVVYDKGSVIFSMLAGMLDDRVFLNMLGSLAGAASNRMIDTATFIAAMERMSGLDLGRFARRYVYGTGIPEFHYDYEIARGAAGGWVISGHTRPVGVLAGRYRIVERGDGWDVLPLPDEGVAPGEVDLEVPFQVVLRTTRTPTGSKPGTARGFGGRLRLPGEEHPFEVTVPEEPAEFWLDQRGEVLGRFHNARRTPKRSLRDQADRLRLKGELRAATETYRRALQAPVLDTSAPTVGLDTEDLKWEARHEDARIRIGLARVHLALDDDDAAGKELDLAEELLLSQSSYAEAPRLTLHCRLALRRGDHSEVIKRVGRYLGIRPDGRLRKGVPFDLDMRERPDGEMFALLAAAAFEQGRGRLTRETLDAAERLGVETDALEARMKGR